MFAFTRIRSMSKRGGVWAGRLFLLGAILGAIAGGTGGDSGVEAVILGGAINGGIFWLIGSAIDGRKN